MSVDQKINEEWFENDSFLTFKNNITIKYERPLVEGVVDTLEGVMKHSATAVVITGVHGEKYPIEWEKFNKLYTIIDENTATNIKIEKLAKLADHDGVIQTSWGSLEYTANNDVIIRHGVDDYAPVKLDIFKKTYFIPNTILL